MLQIKEFVMKLDDSRSRLSDSQSTVIWNIAVDLQVALKSSNQDERPIPPQDLQTVAKFLEVVAE